MGGIPSLRVCSSLSLHHSEGIAPIGAICNAAISACAAQHLWQRALCLLDVAEGLPGGAEFWQILSDGQCGFSGAGTKPVRCFKFQVNAKVSG